MEIGIIGLPTSGKTTIFNALTGANRATSAASTGRLELFSASVDVPDPRVDQLSAMYHPKKTTYAKVTYVDIAGMDQDLGKTGLSGELRNKLAPLDAFLYVIRAFLSNTVPHVFGSVDPQRDLEHLESEFLLADLIAAETQVERITERLRKGARGEDRERLEEDLLTFQQLRQELDAGRPLRDLELDPGTKARLRGFGFLTIKPVLVVLNTDDDPSFTPAGIHFAHRSSAVLALKGQLEMELRELPPDEVSAFMDEYGIRELALPRVIQLSYQLLGLHSFFTVGEDEVRAWTLPVGGTALDAAAAIHSDLARGFIRAEVVAFDDLTAAGSMTAARRMGKVHLEGKSYIIKDGDVVHIRFSV